MEKDIEIIQNIIYNQNGDQMNYIDIDNGTPDNECETFITAIEHLIKGYKQLEEENRIYRLEGCRVRLKMYIDKNYISKSLVKEKIEELKEIADEDNQDEYIKIQVLQELLREE